MRSNHITALLLTWLFFIPCACGGGGTGGGTDPDLGGGDPSGPDTPRPALTSVVPASGTAAGGSQVTLRGRGFLAGVQGVDFGGNPATSINILGDTSLTCSTPARETLGAVSVQVRSDDGTAVLPEGFTYTDPALEPALGLLSGTYFVSSLDHSGLAASARTTWGSWIADGAGLFSATWGENVSGTIADGKTALGNEYTSLVNGTLNVRLSTQSGSLFTGGITSDGDIALLAQMGTGTAPSIAVGSLREGAFSDKTLNGTFHCAGLVPSGSACTSFWGRIEFTGSGAVTSGSVTKNMAGTVSTPVAVSGTYSVSADGTLVLATDLTANLLRGGVYDGGLDGGGFLHASGGATVGDVPEFLVAIPYPITNSVGDWLFSGEYWVVGLVADVSRATTTVFSGTVIADGSGGLDFTTTQNDEGVVSTGLSESETYEIDVSGSMTIGGGGRAGAISQDGRFAWIAGETSADMNPLMMVLVRK